MAMMGSEWRKERLVRRATTQGNFQRDVESAFAEFAIFIGNVDEPYSTPRMELSLAGRYG